MNKERRKAIRAVYEHLAAYQAGLNNLPDIQGIKNDLENLLDEEQEYKDSIPEGLQDSEKGQAADLAISEMEAALDKIEEIADMDLASEIESALESLDNAEHV